MGKFLTQCALEIPILQATYHADCQAKAGPVATTCSCLQVLYHPALLPKSLSVVCRSQMWSSRFRTGSLSWASCIASERMPSRYCAIRDLQGTVAEPVCGNACCRMLLQNLQHHEQRLTARDDTSASTVPLLPCQLMACSHAAMPTPLTEADYRGRRHTKHCASAGPACSRHSHAATPLTCQCTSHVRSCWLSSDATDDVLWQEFERKMRDFKSGEAGMVQDIRETARRGSPSLQQVSIECKDYPQILQRAPCCMPVRQERQRQCAVMVVKLCFSDEVTSVPLRIAFHCLELQPAWCCCAVGHGLILSVTGVQWTEDQVWRLQLHKDAMHSRHGPAPQDTVGQRGGGPCPGTSELLWSGDDLLLHCLVAAAKHLLLICV